MLPTAFGLNTIVLTRCMRAQGGCKYRYAAYFTAAPMLNCTNLFRRGLCKSFGVPLILTTVWEAPENVAYIGPRFEAHLDLLGLGDISALLSLSINVIQTAPIPENITLSFLPKLRFVQSFVLISECAEEYRGLGSVIRRRDCLQSVV